MGFEHLFVLIPLVTIPQVTGSQVLAGPGAVKASVAWPLPAPRPSVPPRRGDGETVQREKWRVQGVLNRPARRGRSRTSLFSSRTSSRAVCSQRRVWIGFAIGRGFCEVRVSVLFPRTDELTQDQGCCRPVQQASKHAPDPSLPKPASPCPASQAPPAPTLLPPALQLNTVRTSLGSSPRVCSWPSHSTVQAHCPGPGCPSGPQGEPRVQRPGRDAVGTPTRALPGPLCSRSCSVVSGAFLLS